MGMTGWALVTGASTGIGRATVAELLRQGMHVAAGLRNLNDAEGLKEESPKANALLLPLALDVTDAAQIRDAAAQLSRAAAGRLKALVNNAGIAVPGPVETLPVSEWRRQFEVNLFGQVAVTQAFLPMLRLAQGRIVNVSSIGGRVAQPVVAPYTASKFALEAMSDSLRMELRPDGVHVVLVEPGAVRSAIWDKASGSVLNVLSQMTEAQRTRYDQAVRAVEAAAMDAARRAIPAERVAGVIARALASRVPRTRYLVGPDAWAAAWLKALLPDRWLDGMLMRRLGVK